MKCDRCKQVLNKGLWRIRVLYDKGSKDRLICRKCWDFAYDEMMKEYSNTIQDNNIEDRKRIDTELDDIYNHNML